MKVLFNTEGNKNIGMGALYDCAVLAGKMREKFNPQIKFLLSLDSEKNIENAIFPKYTVERVNVNSAGLLLESIARFNPNIIVHNLLNLKKDYTDGLNKFKATVVSISHKSNFKNHSKADIVINLLYSSERVKCLHGPRYAILDNRFAGLVKRTIGHPAGNLLISFGGADVNNLTLKLIKVLDNLGLNFRVGIVAGAGFGKEKELQKCLNSLKNKNKFTIYKRVKNMPELMLSSDLAFVSGGRTICELAATGTPGIAFAQNKLEFGRLKEFKKWGTVLNYGYFPKNTNKLAVDIKKVILDRSLCEKMSRNGKKLIDGSGVNRIIGAIMEHHKQAQTVRGKNEKNKSRQ